MTSSRSTDVDALLIQRAHPHVPAVEALRAELLAVPDVVESVKWNSPNYALADDFATINLRRDDAVQLILHTGAKPKPEHPDIVIDRLPPQTKRADRNRLVITVADRSLSPEQIAELAAVIRSWTAQLR